MQHRPVESLPAGDVGSLLRGWRDAHRLSQAALAADAEISPRHLSFIECGKSQPSREVLDRLAGAMHMPLRDRNQLLKAAGYAAAYGESRIDGPELAQVRHAIDCILNQQEPYPAFVMNRHWDILWANEAAARVNADVMQGRKPKHANMIRQFFDPGDLRGAVENWNEIAQNLLRHLQELVATNPTDTIAKHLLSEVLQYPDVPAAWRRRVASMPPASMMTTVLRGSTGTYRFFSTITTFGTPWDVTVDDLHIESCFPVDQMTENLCRGLRAPS